MLTYFFPAFAVAVGRIKLVTKITQNLRGFAPKTEIPEEVTCVLEIVIDGLDVAGVGEAMRRGLRAAAGEGIVSITAGNYGGNLGQFKIGLHDLLH